MPGKSKYKTVDECYKYPLISDIFKTAEETLNFTCSKSALNTTIAAFDKLRNALEEAKSTEEIIALTAAVSNLIRARYIQDAVKHVPTDIDPAPCEDGSKDGNI